jgi:hypothetical protein
MIGKCQEKLPGIFILTTNTHWLDELNSKSEKNPFDPVFHGNIS